MNAERLYTQSIRPHEGLRLKPYKDSKKLWTIGIGELIHTKQMSFFEALNLWNNGWTESHAIERCKMKIKKAEMGARRILGPEYWHDLSDVRQEVLTEMVYQMGARGVGKFTHTLAYIRDGEHEQAAEEMLDSKWFREDTPRRAQTLSDRYAANSYDDT